MTRAAYWFQPALGVALAVLSLYTIVAVTAFEAAGIPSIQFVINGVFVFPGLLISLAVNQLLLRRRRPRTVSTAERYLLLALGLVVVILVATSFDLEALMVGVLLWPLLILLAIVTTIVIVVTSGRLARGEAPTQTPAPEPERGTMDDLFGG